MKHLALPLLLLAATLSAGPAPVLAPSADPSSALAADYHLAWDDSLDGTLEDVGKTCLVRLQHVDGRVTGAFAGPVLGQVREALFTGELSVDGSLLLLQQREAGYLCSYQLHPLHGKAGLKTSKWHGTWADSRGAAGTVRLSLPTQRLTHGPTPIR